MSKVYLIGSMKNERVQNIASAIRELGFDVFDDWISSGPNADDEWQRYENRRGRSYKEALYGRHAQNVYAFDKQHLTEADVVVLVMPCGRSGHLELGWGLGQGKPGYVLFDAEPERFDIMYQLASGVAFGLDELLGMLANYLKDQSRVYRRVRF